MRMARQSILDTGKTPSWAGATPLLGASGCPKNRGIAPAQGTQCAFLFAECFARVQRKQIKEEEEEYVNHQQATGTR